MELELMKLESAKQIKQVSNVRNKTNQCITSMVNVPSGGVHTRESLNVNTLLEAPINIQEIDFSRQSFIKCLVNLKKKRTFFNL